MCHCINQDVSFTVSQQQVQLCGNKSVDFSSELKNDKRKMWNLKASEVWLLTEHTFKTNLKHPQFAFFSTLDELIHLICKPEWKTFVWLLDDGFQHRSYMPHPSLCYCTGFCLQGGLFLCSQYGRRRRRHLRLCSDCNSLAHDSWEIHVNVSFNLLFYRRKEWRYNRDPVSFTV